MAWQCKLADFEHAKEIGAIWHFPNEERLFVTLPGEHSFFALNPANGWAITGEAPNITITPSIRVHGGWHGYIRDGTITDDVEGRTF